MATVMLLFAVHPFRMKGQHLGAFEESGFMCRSVVDQSFTSVFPALFFFKQMC